MLKPSLQTRTKLSLYINEIGQEHKRYDFSQVLRKPSIYHTMWRIVQLGRMAFMTLGDVDRNELWCNDHKTSLKDLIKSLADDSEECDLHIQCTGGAVKIQFGSNPNFQDLVETLVVDELDRAHRGIARGDQRVIEQFDQAMLELIYEVGLTASAENRFFNHFLRDVMVLVSPRYNWMAEHVSKSVPVPVGAVISEEHVSATCAFLPDWITADKGVHQVLPEFQIDAAVFDESVQATWNDQAPINQLIFLIRQALGSKDDTRTQNCFTTLVGSLDQFTTLLLAQAMVKRDLPQTQAPEASETAQEAPVIKGTEPGAQGDIQRALSDMTWLFEEVDPVEGDRLGDPLPESWSKAADIIRAALRKSARRGTNNGTSALDLNGMIERAIIALIGPAPSKGVFPGDRQQPQHPMLRRSEEPTTPDPAEQQRLNIEQQRYAQKLSELAEDIKQHVTYFGEAESVTPSAVAQFVADIGEETFQRENLGTLSKRYIEKVLGSKGERTDQALNRLCKAVPHINSEYVKSTAVIAACNADGSGPTRELLEQLVADLELYLASRSIVTELTGDLLPKAKELLPAAAEKVRLAMPRPEIQPAGEDMRPETVSNTFLFESLPQALRDFFGHHETVPMVFIANGDQVELSKKGEFFDGLAQTYTEGSFYHEAVLHMPDALSYIDRVIAEVMGKERTTFNPLDFREKLIKHLVVEHYSLMDETFVRDRDDLDKAIWYFMNSTKEYVHAVRERAVSAYLLFGEEVPDWNTTPVGNDRHDVMVWARSVVNEFYGPEEARVEDAWEKFKEEAGRHGFPVNAELDRQCEGANCLVDRATLEPFFMKEALLRYGPTGECVFSNHPTADSTNLFNVLRGCVTKLENDMAAK